MRKPLVLLLFLSFVITGLAQRSSLAPNIKKLQGDTIVWRKDSLLTKDDFKAKPHQGGPMGYTVSSIFFYTNENNGQLVFEVEALFLKSKSYIVQYSEYVLKHEQLHFNITELYARKLRKMIADKDFKKVSNMNQVIQNMYNKVEQEWERTEQKYDDETNHGLNAARQQEWSDNIKSQLDALDAYSNTEVNIVK
ncbi:MAG TPA: DUF922 domain-containing protein [Bacteroidia bacterium]|jgi:hypothetical protein|nr:DUF922 domain-containing protein [Bacteroidia bacterium]